jgi:lipopolysaccharide/colanic/teichoic acid biosynthesis glycosyltransferase
MNGEAIRIPITHKFKGLWRNLGKSLSSTGKRSFDVFFSFWGLFFLLPLFIVIAVLIKRDSPGPVFYRGSRAGKGLVPFSILKFRTMYEEPKSYRGPRITAQDDPRITPLGRWLRDSKINELPQLWNVLKGEMSLVGPRPEDNEIAQEWSEDERREILSVRPGITSPASVLYRNEETLLSGKEVMGVYLQGILPSKLRLDQLYVRHRSFLLDLDIIFWTLLVFLPRLGEYAPPEEYLFWGPLSRLFRRYVSWFVLDSLVTFAAIGVTGVFWRSFGPLDVGWPWAVRFALGFALLFSLTGAARGTYRITWEKTGGLDAIDLIPALGVATIASLLGNAFLLPHPFPPALILMAAALAYFGFVAVRYRSRLLGSLASRWLVIRRGAVEARERVLIVGGGEGGQFMSWLLHNSKTAGAFHPIGFIDDDLYKQGTRIHGLNVIGKREDIQRLVKENDVGIIIFAIHNIDEEDRDSLLEICNKTGARVVVVPDILGYLNDLVNTQGDDKSIEFFDPSKVNGEKDNKSISIETKSVLFDWENVLENLERLLEAGDLVAVSSSIQLIREEIQREIARNGSKRKQEV